jgi:ribonuclease HI
LSSVTEKLLLIYSDGASKGNPGKASIGAVFILDGEEIAQISKAIGTATNNIAEYTALLEALKLAGQMGFTHIEVRADSELMIRQLNGIYKVKNPDIAVLYQQIQILKMDFSSISFKHVRREQNTRADYLANQAL